jgi:hypothetical protein
MASTNTVVAYKLDPDSDNVIFGSTTINSCVGWKRTAAGEETRHTSGGIKTIGAVYQDGLFEEVSIVTTDIEQVAGSTFTPGATGAVVIKMIKRADGAGTTGSTKVVTLSKAQLRSIEFGVGTGGVGEASLVFTGYSSTGGAISALT